MTEEIKGTEEIERNERKTEGLRERIRRACRTFVIGTFMEKRVAAIRKEAWDMNDNVMLLLFGDYLGLPNPISYYTLELLPYLAEEMLPWQRRIMNRQSVVAEKAAQYDFT